MMKSKIPGSTVKRSLIRTAVQHSEIMRQPCTADWFDKGAASRRPFTPASIPAVHTHRRQPHITGIADGVKEIGEGGVAGGFRDADSEGGVELIQVGCGVFSHAAGLTARGQCREDFLRGRARWARSGCV